MLKSSSLSELTAPMGIAKVLESEGYISVDTRSTAPKAPLSRRVRSGESADRREAEISG
jgi:hypothetical protein